VLAKRSDNQFSNYKAVVTLLEGRLETELNKESVLEYRIHAPCNTV